MTRQTSRLNPSLIVLLFCVVFIMIGGGDGSCDWRKKDRDVVVGSSGTRVGVPDYTENAYLGTDPNSSVVPLGSATENSVFDLINTIRVDNGLPKFLWSNDVAAVARAHSTDMRDRNYLSHVNPEGQSPFDRLAAAGVTFSAAGENVASGYPTAQDVVNGWMTSPPHRANILQPAFTHMGIGHVTGGALDHAWTQMFIRFP